MTDNELWQIIATLLVVVGVAGLVGHLGRFIADKTEGKDG